jgi:hypothetical protein
VDETGLRVQQDLQIVHEPEQGCPDPGVKIGIGGLLDSCSGQRQDNSPNSLHDFVRRARDLQR